MVSPTLTAWQYPYSSSHGIPRVLVSFVSVLTPIPPPSSSDGLLRTLVRSAAVVSALLQSLTSPLAGRHQKENAESAWRRGESIPVGETAAASGSSGWR